MAFDLGTPVNTALLLYILYSIQRILFPSNSVSQTVPNEFKNGYTWMPKSHPPTLLYQTYTPKKNLLKDIGIQFVSDRQYLNYDE